MEYLAILQEILPSVLMDHFDIVEYKKSDNSFDIYLDEKKVNLPENHGNIIGYGFEKYHTIQDFPIRGRATYLHVRRRKWLNKDTGEIFSCQCDTSEYNGTQLNAEFVAFLKGGD